MALPTNPTSSWLQSTGFPSRLFATGREGYELYEEDGEFVLSIELPGFDREEISVTWNEGTLNVGAEHTDDARGERKTYRRRFRFPQDVDDEDIEAHYRNGILEVRLPVLSNAALTGTEIPVSG